MAADFADADASDLVADAALEKFGRIDALVNAAGVTDRGSMMSATPALWDRLHAVNAKTPFFLMQRAIADMRARKKPGAIVNILSINVHGGATDLTVYASSKAALALITKNAAHAHRFDRIRINGINMGWADTPAERVMHAETLGKGPDWLAEQAAQQPFGRLLVAEDVARLDAFPAVAGFRADDRRADRPGAVCRRAEGRMKRLERGKPFARARQRAPAGLRQGKNADRLRPYRRRRVPPLPSGRIHRGRSGGRRGRPRRDRRQHPAAIDRRSSLTPQDGLYTRLLVEGDKADARVIGSIRRVLDADREPGKAVAALADPGIDVISMTVTEKGYCHIPSSGVLDWDRPEIAADLKLASRAGSRCPASSWRCLRGAWRRTRP